MTSSAPIIPPEERTLAALTHLSGLASYVIPFGGFLVPIILWAVKKDSPFISSIAKQALLLNVVVYLLVAGMFILWVTIILIPLLLLLWAVLGVIAIALPIVGAVQAWEGRYFRYPVVGVQPV